MLRKLEREEKKPTRVPHPNLLKNTGHYYSIGYLDFPKERQRSTSNLFHGMKNFDPQDRKLTRSNASQFSLSHNHVGHGSNASISRSDFRSFAFKQGKGSQKLVNGENRDSSRTGNSFANKDSYAPAASFTKKVSTSLLPRDVSTVDIAEVRKPSTSKEDLLKSKFILKNIQNPVRVSHYGETYTNLKEKSTLLPSISFKHNHRDFNIISGTNKANPPSCSHYHQRYEHFDPSLSQHRLSNNITRMSQTNPRLDPITGRKIGKV